MPIEHQIHVLLAFAKRTGKRNELGLIVAPLSSIMCCLVELIHADGGELACQSASGMTMAWMLQVSSSSVEQNREKGRQRK